MPPALKLLECLPDMDNQVKLIVFTGALYIMPALIRLPEKIVLFVPFR
jgi:hypothetical protein